MLHMQRVQIRLTEEQVSALKRQAEGTGEGLSEQLQRAVDAWIATTERDAIVRRALEAIGGFHSGLGDLAENHDDYLTASDE